MTVPQGEQIGTVPQAPSRWWNSPLLSAIIAGVLSPIIITLLALVGSWLSSGDLITLLGGVSCNERPSISLKAKMKNKYLSADNGSGNIGLEDSQTGNARFVVSCEK